MVNIAQSVCSLRFNLAIEIPRDPLRQHACYYLLPDLRLSLKVRSTRLSLLNLRIYLMILLELGTSKAMDNYSLA